MAFSIKRGIKIVLSEISQLYWKGNTAVWTNIIQGNFFLGGGDKAHLHDFSAGNLIDILRIINGIVMYF